MDKKRKKYIYFIPAAVIMVLIFCFSSQTGDASTKLSDGVVFALSDDAYSNGGLYITLVTFVRKSAHFIEYALLGTALIFGFAHSTEQKTKKEPILSLLTAAFYAGTDEFHQLFVDGRACMLTDVFIDTAGALTGILIYLAVCFIYRKFTKK